jgi:Cu-processing system ATP-binding protein
MISLKAVTKRFGKLYALDAVNLELTRSKSYALLGPNGSGKTTLIKTILGLVIPTSGEILFDGASIHRQCTYRSKIGYMPQIGHFPQNMRVGELLDMMQNIRSVSANELDDDLIREFKLYLMYDKPMHTLSGGTRQKVSAAMAFMFNVPVLILDEPTAGLDPISVEILKEKMISQRRAGKLLLITSHILSDLDELASDVVYIQDGKVQYSDTIENLKQETQEKRLSKAITSWLGQQQSLSTLIM